MKNIAFDPHGHDAYTVTNAAYEQIVALVLANLRCDKCAEPYTEKNPRVARNQCCRCFADYHSHASLTLVDMLPPEYDDRDYYAEKPIRWARWIDPYGKIHLSSYGNLDLREDPGETLKYWGFPFPTEHVSPTGEVYKLHSSEWSIIGDVQTRRILILSYRGRSYDNMPDVQYSSTKGGNYALMDKRKREIRELYRQADQSTSSRYKSYNYEQMLDELEEHQSRTLIIPVPLFGDPKGIAQAKGERQVS